MRTGKKEESGVYRKPEKGQAVLTTINTDPAAAAGSTDSTTSD